MITSTDRVLLAGVAAGLAASTAAAQDLTVKAPPQSNTIAVVGATVHTMKDGEKPIEDGVVWFEGGLVRGVMSRAAWEDMQSRVRWARPPEIIDAKGKQVWPGLIAPQTQLGLTEIQAVRQTHDMTETGGVTPEARPAVAVNPDSTLIPVTRTNGVLLAGVFPTGGRVPGQVSVIRLDGWTMEDMTAEPSSGLIVTWPQVRPISAWWMDRSDEDQARDASRGIEEISKLFDTAEEYARAKAADPAMPTDLRWEAMRPVLGRVRAESEGAPDPLFILAQDADQITGAVTFCVERKLRCVIVGGREAPLCAELLRQHAVPVIVTGTHVMPRRDDSDYDEPFRLPAKLHELGILFTIANNDDTAHERNLPYSAATAVKFGLPHEAGVYAITHGAAKVLGVADRYGSLEEGKSATLLITDGSPLEVVTKIDAAFIDGRRIDLTNKQTVLFEKYKERYRQTGDLKANP